MTLDVALQRAVPGFTLEVAFSSTERVTSLFGRSGSGKSMTLGLIAGLARPDAGHVRVGDATILDTTVPRYVPMHRRRIGLVFQDALLLPHLTVRQNLLFGRWFAGRRTAHRIDFDQVVATLGIGELLERRPARLSGGERQRVAIGRALLADPRLLLFDEPLASLDRQRRLEILPLIERLRDEFAIPMVWVSHATDEVMRLGGHTVLMDEGCVVASGTPEAVLGATRATGTRSDRASVLMTTVGASDDAFGLTALHHPAGMLWFVGRTGPAGRALRVLIRADDVSLTTGEPGSMLSIRSALAGSVAAIEPDGALAVTRVALPGGDILVALVTRRALHDLDLGVGSPVTALVKSVLLDEGAVPFL